MKQRNGWQWVPSLYLYQGIPYSIVMTTSALFYKQMGVEIALFTFWTSLLYLPWTIKPLWSPLVEKHGTKRKWVIITQLLIAIAFTVLGLCFNLDSFFPISICLLALIAFGSASHDIACDGFYILALPQKEQQFFVGIRTTFYRVAMLAALGFLPMLVGVVHDHTSNVAMGWTIALSALGIFLLALALYNHLALPHPTDNTSATSSNSWQVCVTVLCSFFCKKGALPAVLFFLLYRLGEAQLAKIATPFLIDDRANGGLAMSTLQYGSAYGTAGMIALTLGGIAGGWLASRFGLRRVIWPMVAFMNLPNIVYVVLAATQPAASDWSIYAAIVTEQLGYGFGFTAYMLFLLHYVSDSEYKTAEYALGTALMSLGMMLPGMVSGYVSELLGYQWFFVYVLICCIPGTILTAFLPLGAENKSKVIHTK